MAVSADAYHMHYGYYVCTSRRKCLKCTSLKDPRTTTVHLSKKENYGGKKLIIGNRRRQFDAKWTALV